MQDARNNGEFAGLTVDWVPPRGRSRTGTVVVRNGSDDPYTTRLDIANAKKRSDLMDTLAERWPTLKDPDQRHDIEAKLENLAADQAANEAKGDEAPEVPAQPDSAELLATMPDAVKAEARSMLESPNLLNRVGDDFSTVGIAGERPLAGTIYLTGVSRLLDRPLKLLIQGPSSSGKSYIEERVANLFPAESLLVATTMTAAALYYAPAGSLRHKFVVAGERSRLQDDEQSEVNRALRQLMSEGRISRLVTFKQPDGSFVSRLVEQEGPIAYVESTTLAANKVFAEDLNRMLLVSTDETPEQTEAVLRRVADKYRGGVGVGGVERTIERHHAIQRMLHPWRVAVPFAHRLVKLLPATRLEIRRGGDYLLGMVAASALLHQFQRKTTVEGELVASLDDYRVARALLADPLGRLLGRRTSDGAIRFLGRLVAWFGLGGEYTVPEARAKEQHSASGVYLWNSELVDAGLVEIAESKRGNSPARWRVAKSPDQAAESLTLLPEAETLEDT